MQTNTEVELRRGGRENGGASSQGQRGRAERLQRAGRMEELSVRQGVPRVRRLLLQLGVFQRFGTRECRGPVHVREDVHAGRARVWDVRSGHVSGGMDGRGDAGVVRGTGGRRTERHARQPGDQQFDEGDVPELVLRRVQRRHGRSDHLEHEARMQKSDGVQFRRGRRETSPRHAPVRQHGQAVDGGQLQQDVRVRFNG